jgi:hypothetical protein
MRHETCDGGRRCSNGGGLPSAGHRPFFGGPLNLNLNLHKAAIAAGPVQLLWALDRTLCIV